MNKWTFYSVLTLAIAAVLVAIIATGHFQALVNAFGGVALLLVFTFILSIL